MSEGPNEEEPVYPGVKVRIREIGNFIFEIAEIRSLRRDRVTRDHLRIIGAGAAELVGRPIVYSDAYQTWQEDDVYVYARHGVDRSTFFSRLDAYLLRNLAEFPELAEKPLHVSLQVDGEFTEAELPLPVGDNLEVSLDQIEFARVSSLLGDIAIEFTDRPTVSSREHLFSQKGALPRKLESPLFGFEASRSDFWTNFLAEIHWASGLLPKEILRTVIQSAAQVAAY